MDDDHFMMMDRDGRLSHLAAAGLDDLLHEGGPDGYAVAAAEACKGPPRLLSEVTVGAALGVLARGPEPLAKKARAAGAEDPSFGHTAVHVGQRLPRLWCF